MLASSRMAGFAKYLASGYWQTLRGRTLRPPYDSYKVKVHLFAPMGEYLKISRLRLWVRSYHNTRQV